MSPNSEQLEWVDEMSYTGNIPEPKYDHSHWYELGFFTLAVEQFKVDATDNIEHDNLQ